MATTSSLCAAELGLEVLKQALKHDLIVSQEISSHHAPHIYVRHFAGNLQADFIDIRRHGRIRPGIAGRRDELDADLSDIALIGG